MFWRNRKKAVRKEGSESWEQRWNRDDFAPFWLTDRIPAPVERAFADQSFTAGQSILDIGCGRGDLAAYLAKRGLQVLGIDIAESAIRRANQLFSGIENLHFRQTDFCAAAPAQLFDHALDRGCFHSIPMQLKESYVRNLAKCLRPGGSFLLLHKSGWAGSHETIPDDDLAKDVLGYFQPAFRLEWQCDIEFGDQSETLSGTAFLLRA